MERYELPNWIPEWAVTDQMRIIIAYRELRSPQAVLKQFPRLSQSWVYEVIANYRKFLSAKSVAIVWQE